jgi:hypothetical protein
MPSLLWKEDRPAGPCPGGRRALGGFLQENCPVCTEVRGGHLRVRTKDIGRPCLSFSTVPKASEFHGEERAEAFLDSHRGTWRALRA